jgi:glycosyltransferase involved in cell wall biosynthesis
MREKLYWNEKREVPMEVLKKINARTKPLVSVVIPTINGREEQLVRAVRSVKAQTYTNIELIVVNRGRPAPEQRNIGIEQSTGKYIAFLDDDDEWDKTKIAMQVVAMEKCHWRCPLCICWSRDDRFGMIRVSKPMDITAHKDLIKSFNLSSTSSYLVLREALDWGNIRFDEDLPSAQEYDLALQLSKLGNIICVPRVLMHQHATEGQISCNWGRKIRGIYAIAWKYHKEYDVMDALKTIGLMGFFWLGNIFGTKIYLLLTAAKEVYET